MWRKLFDISRAFLNNSLPGVVVVEILESFFPQSVYTYKFDKRYFPPDKTQYFRLRLYDSDLNALIARYLLSDCSVTAN